MADVKSQVLALSLLSAGEAAHAFSAWLPSYFTIKTFALDGENTAEKIAKLRSGYWPALAFGLGLGAVISVLAHSRLPLFFSAATGAAMITLYEAALPADQRLLGTLALPERGRY